MIGTQAATRYRRSSVSTISREKLLILLFDGAIGFARASRARLDAGDSAGFREYLGKCQAIVMEFLNTLNMKDGGEVAANLQRIYLFLIDHLNEANIHKRGKNMDDTVRILTLLRDGFDGAIRSLASTPRGGC